MNQLANQTRCAIFARLLLQYARAYCYAAMLCVRKHCGDLLFAVSASCHSSSRRSQASGMGKKRAHPQISSWRLPNVFQCDFRCIVSVFRVIEYDHRAQQQKGNSAIDCDLWKFVVFVKIIILKKNWICSTTRLNSLVSFASDQERNYNVQLD